MGGRAAAGKEEACSQCAVTRPSGKQHLRRMKGEEASAAGFPCPRQLSGTVGGRKSLGEPAASVRMAPVWRGPVCGPEAAGRAGLP